MLQSLATYTRRALLDAETERVKDVWDLAAFGFTGQLTFTKISKPWLRTAVMRWAAHELPRRRGRVRQRFHPGPHQRDGQAVDEPASGSSGLR